MFMIPILQFFAEKFHSYGWAIVALTLLVRIIVWPLVASSTRSMQKMARLQPKLKALQEKYKDDPQVFQQKTMEFWQKNKANPVGGCLPTLVQLPVLFALFACFTGPPFQDKGVPVKVNIIAQKDRASAHVVVNQTSEASSAYVSKDGKLAKVVVHPGNATVVQGETAEGQPIPGGINSFDYRVDAAEGSLPADFKAKWKIGTDPHKAMADTTGGVRLPEPGDITLEAVLPDGKSIPVELKVVPKQGGDAGFFGQWFSHEDPFKEKTEHSKASVDTVFDGKNVTVAIAPGESTITAGSLVHFKLVALQGELPADFQHAIWKVTKDPNGAMITDDGHATFPKPGEVTVEAMVPGEAQGEQFLFISNLGKVPKGMELLEPKNWDVLGMILSFGVTMWLSQKLMTTPGQTASMDPEQAAIQKSTQQTMPIVFTAMFFFIPLPAGVYLYMVISNVVQSLQTWILLKTPTPDIVDVDDDGPNGGGGGGVIDVTPTDSGNGSDSGTVLDLEKQKRNKQKKK